ncbi:MAG: hypothetical protein NTW60_03990 [Candidatus Wolfebacteria bacterium]|nr:hypothetical protein [Candidatus Wolfebacteria bacterium]
MKFKIIFIEWLPIGVTVSFLAVMAYGLVQQTIRLSVNSEPAQIANDVASILSQGVEPSYLIGGEKTEITKQLAPYVIVYGLDGKVAASSASFDGQSPNVPQGILAEAKLKGEDRVTWQPRAGIRQALVAVSYNNGVVVSGKSLKEPEKLIGLIGRDSLIGWAATMLVSFAAVFAIHRSKLFAKL